MVKKVDIWNDNIYTDNFKLFFDDLITEKPDKIILTKSDDDKNNAPNKWEFEIVDKEYIDNADEILQQQIDSINSEIEDDYCKLIQNRVTLPEIPSETGTYYVNATAKIEHLGGSKFLTIDGTANVFTIGENIVTRTHLQKGELDIEGVSSLVVVAYETYGLAYAIIDRVLNHIFIENSISITEITYTKMEDLELRVDKLEATVAEHSDTLESHQNGIELLEAVTQNHEERIASLEDGTTILNESINTITENVFELDNRLTFLESKVEEIVVDEINGWVSLKLALLVDFDGLDTGFYNVLQEGRFYLKDSPEVYRKLYLRGQLVFDSSKSPWSYHLTNELWNESDFYEGIVDISIQRSTYIHFANIIVTKEFYENFDRIELSLPDFLPMKMRDSRGFKGALQQIFMSGDDDTQSLRVSYCVSENTVTYFCVLTIDRKTFNGESASFFIPNGSSDNNNLIFPSFFNKVDLANGLISTDSTSVYNARAIFEIYSSSIVVYFNYEFTGNYGSQIAPLTQLYFNFSLPYVI